MVRPPVLLFLSALLVGGLAQLAPSASANTTTFQVGVTHTQYSADGWRNPTAVGRARQVLAASVPVQAQALMGWGADNPEPAPGQYDWSTLDERLNLITSSHGAPIITLCCAPDWMKGGGPGTTDWSKIEVAPLPNMYGEFAKLAVSLAQRHPEVRSFVVWNELKGFYDSRTNNWNVAAYTNLYNTVYDALKAFDPTLKVGGPYVPMDIFSSAATMSNPSKLVGPWGVVDQRALDAMSYWLAHAHGYDMVSVDGGDATKDKGLITDDSSATSYFTAVTRWLRARTSKQIWWSEFGVGRSSGSTPAHGLQVMGTALQALQKSGASLAMQWHVEGVNTDCVTCLWTDTSTASGGLEAPYAALMRRINAM